MAVVAPIPSASVKTAVAVKTGALANCQRVTDVFHKLTLLTSIHTDTALGLFSGFVERVMSIVCSDSTKRCPILSENYSLRAPSRSRMPVMKR
jgi:hypothetical protein